jgi:hypothetical protein
MLQYRGVEWVFAYGAEEQRRQEVAATSQETADRCLAGKPNCVPQP